MASLNGGADDVEAREAADGESADQRVTRYVVFLVLTSAVAIGAAAVALAYSPPGFLVSPRFVVGFALLVGAFIFLHRNVLHLEYRSHRLVTSFDDVAVFIALLTLPPATVVLALPVVGLIMHYWTQREPIKGAFNVAHEILAAAAAWLTFAGLTSLGVPPILAAAAGIAGFVYTSHGLVAGVFARIEDLGVVSVFAERFLAPATFLLALSAGSGIMLYALWILHPVASLALLPFVYVVQRYGALLMRTDRELSVHRRLASVTFELVGTSSLDAVADRVLDTCGSLLLTGRAVLRLNDPDEGGTREWTRDFTGGPASAGIVEVDLPGREGESLGSISVYPRPAMDGFGDADKEILRIVAGTAAAAVENARALKHLERAREEAVETNEALAKQEKLSTLGTLVAGVAHEIGNPLTYMKGNLELAMVTLDELKRLGGEAAQHGSSLREDLSQAVDGVARLQEITASLKGIARQGRKERHVADLNGIANEVATVVRAGLPRNVTLQVAAADGEIPVSVTRGEITQVALNLVKNAAEAIGEVDGHVTVRVETDADVARLHVEDDGPGIPEDVQENLFKQFFTTKEKGTGLGLNISRRIAESHGGSLACASTVGEGTTFTLTLPIASDDEEDDGCGGLTQA